MLCIRSLEKILNERDIKRPQYAQVKRVCETILQEIRAGSQNQQVVPSDKNEEGSLVDRTNNNNEYGSEDNKSLEKSNLLEEENGAMQIDSEKYFVPFEIACQGDSPRVTVAALDGIQKLLAHGELTGNYPNPKNPNKKLIDRIVETICSCFIGAETDEGVELQIIKALLTVVTSQHVQIHEGSILLTFRTCFNIYLLTKNAINQTTSRAMLTQMLNSIFTRMEIAFEGQEKLGESLEESNNNLDITTEILEQVTLAIKDWDWENISWYSKLDLSSMSLTNSTISHPQLSEESQDSAERDPQNNIINHLEEHSDITHSQDNEPIQDNTTVTSDQVDTEENCEKVSLTEVLPITEEISYPLESNDGLFPANSSPEDATDSVMKESSPKFIHNLQKDAFLVFWALCKLAGKPSVPDDEDNELFKPIDTKSKILSFQLLKSVMEGCGPVFKTDPMFVAAIKQHLCSAMLTRGVSSILEVYQLNLDVLVILIHTFGNSIVEQMEPLCQELLFSPLESSSTVSSEYKLLALGAINRLYLNFKCIIDLFINHDSQGSALFERMIQFTCKFSNLDKHIVPTAANLVIPIRALTLESITSLLMRMTKYLKRDDGNTNNDPENEFSNIENNQVVTVVCDNSRGQDSKSSCRQFVPELISFIGNIPSSADIIEVDLLIQKFAQNVCQKFEREVESADGAYALIYSSISLLGEISSKGKCRAMKEYFVETNRNISWCVGLSEELLGTIYDDVEAFLKQQAKYRKRHNNATVQSHINVVKNTKRLIALIGLHQSSVSTEKQVRYVRRMFKVMGTPVLNALMGTMINMTTPMTDNNEAIISDICLAGIESAIHIASVLKLNKERDNFVQALSRLSLAALKEIKSRNANAMVITSKTSSTTTSENGVTKTIITTTTETKCRNVDIIQTLLNVAINEGNHLSTAWLDTLKCVSQLEAAELMGRTTSPNGSSRSNSPGLGTNNEVKSWYAWAGSLVPNFWDYSGNKLDIASVKESMDSHVNGIFLNSTKLDDNGIVDFCKALCQVSLIEITHPENPRSFVYEKIFEVAHINIPRPCIQWCSIWQVLSDYFSHLACSSDEDVSFFAIDSITKLVTHLLEKETLGNFRFQSHFLKPFEIIMKNTPFVITREYVLESIAKIIKSNAAELRSGWITIFRILESSVYNDDVSNSEISFMMIKSILQMFGNSQINLSSSCVELLRCLKDLAFKGPTSSIQSESLGLLKQIAKLLHDKPELILNDVGEGQVDRKWRQGWLLVFTELSNVVIKSEIYGYDDTMQATALSVIFELIKAYGDDFKVSWWNSLFEVLFTVFSKLKFHEDADTLLADDSICHLNKGDYNQYYCYYYVQFAIVDTFIRYYDTVGSSLLEEVLRQLRWCISQGHEQIALSGVQCLHQIIRMLQQKFTKVEWVIITSLVQNLLQNSYPTALTNKDQEVYSWNPVVQFELLKVVKTILVPQVDVVEEISEIENAENQTNCNEERAPSQCQSQTDVVDAMGKETLMSLLDALEERMRFVNSAILLASANEPQISLQLQDSIIIDTYLRFIFKVYQNPSSDREFEEIEPRFVKGVHSVLEHFVKIPTTDHRNSLTDIITFCIFHIQLLPSSKILSRILYSTLCDMLDMELQPSLSIVLSKYFLSLIQSNLLDYSSKISA